MSRDQLSHVETTIAVGGAGALERTGAVILFAMAFCVHSH